MKVLMKLLLIIAVYCVTVVSVKADPLDSLQHKELVQRGVAALKQVMAQNAWNEANGQAENNKYLVRLDTTYIHQKEDEKGAGRLWQKEFVSSEQEAIINEALKKVNHAADNKKEFGVYVMVFNSYILNLTKTVDPKDPVPNLLSLKKYAEPGAVDVIDQAIDDLNQEIWDQVGFSQNDFTVRIGIVYGREVLLYNRAVSKVMAVTQAQGNGISSGKLQILNANLKGVSSIGSPVAYLTTYPAALYKAFRAKTVPVKLKNKFKPSLNTYFSELADKAPKEYKDGGKDPSPPASRGVPVIDYSHGISPEEMKKILEGINSTSAETGYEPKIFITSYVTPDDVLQKVKDYVANPAGNKEIVIWVHIDADKSIQYEYGYGKDVPEQQDISAFAAILSKVLPELHGNPLADMFDAIAGLIGKAIVPPKYYDPEDPKYNSLPGLVLGTTIGNAVALPIAPILLAIRGSADTDKFSMTRVNFAFTVGLWNGTVDFVKGIANSLNMLSGGKEWDNMKEGLQKLGDLYEKEGISGVFGMFGTMIKDAHTGNPCKVSHTIGVDVINIASFYFAFAKTGAAAQIGRMMEAIDPLTYVFKGVGKITTYAFKISEKAVKGIYQMGKFVVRIHVEPLGPILQWLDQATGKWNYFRFKNDLVLAMADGKQLAIAPNTLNNAKQEAYRFIEAVEENGQVFRDNAGNMLVIVENAGKQELALGRIIKTIEQIDNLLKDFPKLKSKLDEFGEEFKRAFMDDFGEDAAMLKKMEANATHVADHLNPTNWKKLKLFEAAAEKAGDFTQLMAKLEGLNIEDRLRFFSQFGDNADILRLFDKGTEVSMETWKVLSVFPDACKLLENQKFFQKLLTNSKAAALKLDHARLAQIFEARALATRNVSEFASFRDDLGHFVEHFSHVENAESVIANLAKTQYNGAGYIGEEFVIYLLRNAKSPFKASAVKKFQFYLKGEGRYVDIVTSEGVGDVFNELKSVQSFTSAYAKQLLVDLENVLTLDNMRWLVRGKGDFAGAGGLAKLKTQVEAALKQVDVNPALLSKYVPRNQTKDEFVKFVMKNFEDIFQIIE
ncbi:hypothetical protein SAMN05444266_102238 [Chitinophaga jiangningensis]|uniref:Uncharacterized protein n=1 Tax=Chitinophaga jiangningensis TaxID=1419482 RepID=A0A1M6YB93_9BACT|nr:hypothetical protein [Chitinophaga jiangningensis]SHL15526.1 hypothetical protein SAMN05444266_102238 [Chitinophaga jiangningensis]